VEELTGVESILLMDLEKEAFWSSHVPISGGIELTSRCNLKCLQCYKKSSSCRTNDMSTEFIFRLVDQLVDAGVFGLYLTGGEAMLRKSTDTFGRKAYLYLSIPMQL
jgi:MoaA/NifB/PqqE/SkfB family radical SAM enzyme